MNYHLKLLPATFSICRLDAAAGVPAWAEGDFVSVTRTRDELTIVCPQDGVPPGQRCDTDWRCLRLAGVFDLSEIGVLASLLQPLVEARVSAFVVGTFDTDYLMIRAENLTVAGNAWQRAGHTVLPQ